MAFGSFDNKSSGHTVSEINMVPLIDVMLVLLVIFIITAPLLSHSLQIDLPQATGEPVQQEPVIVDLAIDDQGALYWNETPMTLQQLTAELATAANQDPQPSVRIRADADTRYDVLADVISAARSVGVKRLGFVTRPDPTSPASAGPITGGGTVSQATLVPVPAPASPAAP